MGQAEGGQDDREAPVTERQCGRVGSDRPQRRRAPTQRRDGKVSRSHLGRACCERGPAGHPGASTEIQHAGARQQRSYVRSQRPCQRRIHRLGTAAQDCGSAS